jgi:preprotein translocase subunit SecA
MVDHGPVVLRAVFRLLQGFDVARCLKRVEKTTGTLIDLPDADLIAQARRIIQTPKAPDDTGGIEGAFPNHYDLRRLSDQDADALAVAAELFRRFPPGQIIPGASVYPEQLEAAGYLMRGALVQMDTGEGKTYALMLAAFGLLRLFPTVYILTDNPYLVMRDASNVAGFWAKLGVSVGAVLPPHYANNEWPGWEAQIIYTTPESYIFCTMEDQLESTSDMRRIRRGAVLLDEADAALLDRLQGSYVERRNVASGSKDWRLACNMAMLLRPEHVVEDKDGGLDVYLTGAGQAEVIRLSGSLLDDSRHLMLYRDVEVAYSGLRKAVEGRDYEIINDTVVPIDADSGWRTLSRMPSWVTPLAFHRNLRLDGDVMTLNSADGLSRIMQVDHLAGASGTLINEALDYLIVGGFIVAVVQPRHARFDGMKPDFFFASYQMLRQHLESVVLVEAQRRPILIVTSTTAEAYQLAQDLAAAVPAAVTVRFAHGDSFGEQRLFEKAGEVGVVVVSTRQAGRGVDIQLTDEARANGGSLLILIGHAGDARQDRQLIGRVGRSGDPFEAYFCNYPGGALIPAGMKAFMEALKVPVMQSRKVQRALASKQRQNRRGRLQAFASQVSCMHVDDATFSVASRWSELIGEANEQGNLTEDFLNSVASTYAGYNIPGLGDIVTSDQADSAARRLESISSGRIDASSLKARIIGQERAAAQGVLVASLAEQLKISCDENLFKHSEFRTSFDAAFEAVRGLQQLGLSRGRVLAIVRSYNDEDDDAEQLPESSPLRLPESEYLTLPPSVVKKWVSDLRDEGMDLSELLARQGNIDVPLPPVQIFGSVLTLRPKSLLVPDREVLFRLLELITIGENVLRPVAARLPSLYRSRHLLMRTPLRVAQETVYVVADYVDASRWQLIFRLRQQGMRGPKYFNAYQSGMTDLGQVAEAALTEQLCRNLISAEDPESLDQLFASLERARYQRPVALSFGSIGREIPPVLDQLESARPQTRDDLIAYFVQAHFARHDQLAGLKPEDLYPALDAVLSDAPLATLTTPVGVAEALGRWRRHPVRRRLLPWRRHRVDRVVRDFFSYLHEQGVSARLPVGVFERTKPFRKRITSRLSAPRTQIAAMFFAVVLAAYLPLIFLHSGRPSTLRGYSRLVDLTFSAGTFSAGAWIAAALVGICSTAFFTWLLRGFNADLGLLNLERPVLIISGAASAAWLQSRSDAPVMAQISTGVLLLLVSVTLGNLIWLAENLSRIRLVAVFVAVSLGCRTFPALFEANGWKVVIAAGAGALYSIITYAIPLRLPVYALESSDIRSADGATSKSTVSVEARVPWTAHAVSLVVDLGVCRLAHVQPAIGIGAYAIVFSWWTRQLSIGLTAPSGWIAHLRQVDQAYAASAKRPSLADGLRLLRFKFVCRELVLGLGFVGTASWLLPNANLYGGSRTQVGLIAGSLGIFFAGVARSAISSLRNVTALQRPVESRSAHDGLSENLLSDSKDIFRRFKRRLALVMLIYLALAKIAELLDVSHLVHAILDALT